MPTAAPVDARVRLLTKAERNDIQVSSEWDRENESSEQHAMAVDLARYEARQRRVPMTTQAQAYYCETIDGEVSFGPYRSWTAAERDIKRLAKKYYLGNGRLRVVARTIMSPEGS